MKKYTVWFDLDGTLGNLYAVDDWLPKIRHEDASPYLDAAPMLRLCTLARLLNALQRNGYEIGVISWLSKGGSENYGEKVTAAKKEWLSKHLPSVSWNKITIIPYGTPKNNFCESPSTFCLMMKSRTAIAGAAKHTSLPKFWKSSKA